MAFDKQAATSVVAGASLALLPLICGDAWAGNGFNLIGIGAQSVSMGGADVAVTDDASALLLNPAALTRIADSRLDLNFNPYYTPYHHVDSIGNDVETDTPFGTVLGGNYAQRLKSRPDVVLAAGLNLQGGSGFVYDKFKTPFGGRDDLASIFGVFRFAFGGGWQASETLSLGAAAGISYASARQKFFPNTSDAATQFAGFRFDGGQTVQVNGAAGLLYQPIPELRLGLSYTSKIKLPLKGGTANFNYEGIGQGRVRYGDARVDGLALPQELSAGFAWQATPRWLLAADVRWLDWSVIRNNRLRASKPDNANVQNIDQSTPVNLRDQYVVAVGAAYQYDPSTTLRAGINAARNLVPDQSASPLLNLGETHEFDFGIGRQLSKHWQLDTAFQYIPPQKQRYTNPQLPFGASSETFEGYSLVFSLGRSW